LLEAFSLDRCGKSNAIFDYPKLLWLNGTYIRRLTVDELTDRIVPFLAAAELLDPSALDAAARARLASLVALEQERLKTLAEAPDVLGFFYRDPDVEVCVDLLQHNRYAKRHPLPALHHALGQARAALGAVDESAWSTERLAQALDAEVANLGWKRGELLMPVRIAVSGREATPPLYETVVCLGRDATLSRLDSVVSHLPAA
jgi:glutamyl-tRNA synthetase